MTSRRTDPFPDPRPNIGVILRDHHCTGDGGNVWIWTEEDGTPTKAKCAGCNGDITIVHGDGPGLTEATGDYPKRLRVGENA